MSNKEHNQSLKKNTKKIFLTDRFIICQTQYNEDFVQ